MRLIHTTDLYLRYWTTNPPPYAILSHRWLPEDQEVLFHEFGNEAKKSCPGWAKIAHLCWLAKRANIEWAWIDTACIDKSSSAELSEAINSMFAWYRDARICYVFLNDADIIIFNEAFHDPETKHFIPSMVINHNVPFDPQVTAEYSQSWFGRGWTLQELLAPLNLVIYHTNGTLDSPPTSLGTKEELVDQLHLATGIPPKYLLSKQSFREASIAQRMGWAARRTTTRPEDGAYCMLGIFDINMSLLYGEGGRAFRRLQLAILDSTNDDTIFAWSSNGDESDRGLMAHSPAEFGRYPCLVPISRRIARRRPPARNTGQCIELHVFLPTPVENGIHLLLTLCSGMVYWVRMMLRGKWDLAHFPPIDLHVFEFALHCRCSCDDIHRGPRVIRLGYLPSLKPQIWYRTRPQLLAECPPSSVWNLGGFDTRIFQDSYFAPIFVSAWESGYDWPSTIRQPFHIVTLARTHTLNFGTLIISFALVMPVGFGYGLTSDAAVLVALEAVLVGLVLNGFSYRYICFASLVIGTTLALGGYQKN